MDKNTKTLLLVGAGALAVGGVVWWVSSKSRAFPGLPAVQRTARASLTMRPGELIAARREAALA